MRTVPRTTQRVRRVAVPIMALVVLGLTGCGASDDGAADLPEAVAADDVDRDGLPPQCAAVFPAAFGVPDISEVTMLPAGWPAPPPGSTLCQTSETVGGSREEADYATELAPDEVLAAYEQALDPGFGATRQESGLGEEILVGALDGVDFQISAGDGKFSIALAK